MRARRFAPGGREVGLALLFIAAVSSTGGRVPLGGAPNPKLYLFMSLLRQGRGAERGGQSPRRAEGLVCSSHPPLSVRVLMTPRRAR